MAENPWSDFARTEAMSEQQRDWSEDLDGRYSGRPATVEDLRVLQRNTTDAGRLAYIDGLLQEGGA